jgi:uncharacterized protein (UPF0548 family)
MPLFRKPSPATIRAFLAGQSQLDLTYTAIGASAGEPPTRYALNYTRIKLGEGERVFRAARAALERWEQFHLGWIEAYPADTRIRTGAVVAILARGLGLWWLNACRIVYTVEQDAPTRRFGFAYGTLPGHIGSGEERFLIEWDHEGVWYQITAFSRPRHFLARVGYPYLRAIQRRFGRESAASMLRAVGG